MKNKISIYDIAKYSEVSPASVSYVINGKNKVSEETRQKVLKAIEELGYVPNHNARSLSTGKSHLIGLFLPLSDTSVAFLQNPFDRGALPKTINGILDASTLDTLISTHLPIAFRIESERVKLGFPLCER